LLDAIEASKGQLQNKAIAPPMQNFKNSPNGWLNQRVKRGRRGNWWIFDWLRI
jgi:hypothetical protein